MYYFYSYCSLEKKEVCVSGGSLPTWVHYGKLAGMLEFSVEESLGKYNDLYTFERILIDVILSEDSFHRLCEHNYALPSPTTKPGEPKGTSEAVP